MISEQIINYIDHFELLKSICWNDFE